MSVVVVIKENHVIEAKVGEQVFIGRLPAVCTELDQEELSAYVELIQRKNKLSFDRDSRIVTCEPCLGLPDWIAHLRYVPGSEIEKVMWRLKEATRMEANVLFTMRGDGTWRVEHNAPESIRCNFDAWLLAGAKAQFGTYIQRSWTHLTNADKLVELINKSNTFDALQDNVVNKFTFFWSNSEKPTLAHFPLPTWESQTTIGSKGKKICGQEIPSGNAFGERVIQEGKRVLYYIHFPDGLVNVDTFDSSACIASDVYEVTLYFKDGFGNQGRYVGQRKFDPKQMLYYYK